MTDDTVAACRAALLRACRVTDAIIDADREGVPIESVCVDVDDAASCMAEREAKLREALNICAVTLEDAPMNAQWDRDRDTALTVARAALAAAQGGTDDVRRSG